MRGQLRPPLSPREHEALRLYAHLGKREDVADAMGVSRHTIRHQLDRAYLRLGVNTATDAFRAMGWLSPPRRDE